VILCILFILFILSKPFVVFVAGRIAAPVARSTALTGLQDLQDQGRSGHPEAGISSILQIL